jgi:hypothetical protein
MFEHSTGRVVPVLIFTRPAIRDGGNGAEGGCTGALFPGSTRRSGSRIFIFQTRPQVKGSHQPSLATNFKLTSAGFFLYGLTQLFVPVADFFPANLLNSQVFLNLAGFPIQVVRAAMALLVTVGLLRAIQFMEARRQAQLFVAQQAQLEALEQVKQELVAREIMRKELLRHIVIAQEDERARIAASCTTRRLKSLPPSALTWLPSTLRKGEASEIIERLQDTFQADVARHP